MQVEAHRANRAGPGCHARHVGERQRALRLVVGRAAPRRARTGSRVSPLPLATMTRSCGRAQASRSSTPASRITSSPPRCSNSSIQAGILSALVDRLARACRAAPPSRSPCRRRGATRRADAFDRRAVRRPTSRARDRARSAARSRTCTGSTSPVRCGSPAAVRFETTVTSCPARQQAERELHAGLSGADDGDALHARLPGS